MNGKQNKHIYQIIAIILCVAMLVTSGIFNNFKNIFAVNNETKNFTWRETTAERLLHLSMNYEENLGKHYMGEYIDEILQMAKDPSVEFEEENFFQYTCFEGLTLGDLEFLYEEGYNDLGILSKEMVEANCSNLAEYLFGVKMYATGVASGIAGYWNKYNGNPMHGTVHMYVPSANQGSIKNPGAPEEEQVLKTKYFYYLQISGYEAFCLDPGYGMPPDTYYTLDSEITDPKIRRAAYFYYCRAANKSDGTIDFEGGYWNDDFYELAQLYIWVTGDEETYKDALEEYQTSTDFGRTSQDYMYLPWKNRLEEIHADMSYIRSMIGYITQIRTQEVPDDFKLYMYKSADPGHQRLATIYYKAPDPMPDKDSVKESDSLITNKMYVKHNINGTINQNTGKGVIGYWNDEWKDDATERTDYCGSDYTYDTVTVKNFDINEADSATYTLDDAKAAVLYSQRQTGYKSAVQDTYIYKAISTDPVKYYDMEYTHTTYTITYNRFDEAHEQGTTHNIYKPLIRNFQLKINYQGGWYNGTDINTDLGEFNNTATSFSATRDSNKLADNLTSTQRTNVKFTTMEIANSYKLDWTNPDPSSTGSLTTSSGHYQYTHGNIDGVIDEIQFYYEGYYMVYLPTPQRTGYNFLGYYDADGNLVTPKTITVDGLTFRDVYVFDEDYCGTRYTDISNDGDKTLYQYEIYARWELITKDETFTIQWLDNSNNYTTRPNAVYVELYRYTTKTEEAELCKGYIKERLNTSTGDWISNFSNETGLNNKGNKDYKDNNNRRAKKTNSIFDPNVKIYNYSNNTKKNNTENNIFKAGTGTNPPYYLKITGNNNNPATTNTWTITLKDLQKWDTSEEEWTEYTYVIKQVICESLDTTTQYYVSSDASHNTYNTSLSNYYNIKNNTTNNSGQKTKSQYNALNKKSYFKQTVVNRAANVAGPSNWKNITVNAFFKDGPIDNFDDDIYHFRPYSIKIELYQNFAYGKDENSDNFLSDQGVRVLYRTEFMTPPSNAYSPTIPADGFLANELTHTFTKVPTVQDGTCIKIGYDVVLTHGQDRYRYTIDYGSNANNLNGDIVDDDEQHYYANKHETDIDTVIDLDYTILKDGDRELTVIPTVYEIGADGKPYPIYSDEYIDQNTQVYKCDVRETMEEQNTDYEFKEDNFNYIYQSKLNQQDKGLLNSGQNNKYTDGTIATAAAYSTKYKSMAYNIRYYYIEETRNMRATPTHDIYIPLATDLSKATEYLKFKETLYWNFTLTLNDSRTTLPTEYSGSASSDDRTGMYNGGENDDYMHTKNTLVITNKIYADKAQTNATEVNKYGTTSSNRNYDYYDNLIVTPENESFLITLKQVRKTWTNSGHTTGESYDDSKYSINGYKSTSYNDANGNMTIKFVSNSSANASSFNEYEEIGNEYNIQLPAHGTVIIDYIPDGRYEMTCHYDIDFDNYNVTMTNGTVEFEKKNGKWYITISSKPETSTGDFLHAATVDYWRGYVDDESEILSFKTTIKPSVKNSWLNGAKNGFNVQENFDEKYQHLKDYEVENPEDCPSENVIWEDYLVPGYQSGN